MHLQLAVQLISAFAGGVGTLAILRWRARVRGRELTGILTSEDARWAALCRVVKGAEFFDHSRTRRDGGPRGMLVQTGNRLHYRPDPYECRHGNLPLSWRLDDVRCLARRRRRDISGLWVVEARLALPEGIVVLAIFHQKGTTPRFLREPTDQCAS